MSAITLIPGSTVAERHPFVNALAGRIEPVRVGAMYQFALLVAAGTMLALPMIYLALVAGVCYSVVWYAVNGTSIFTNGRVGRGTLLAYLAPLVIGAILIVFMVKPLFARRQKSSQPLLLTADEEPVLFAFVDRLCDVVGSPKPSRIAVDTQVNASASFREGVLGFLRKDLVLTIGLPLVAGLTLRQLTGVLAHEFGHFAQGTGMRLTYLVRSINMWFARVVYERDSWDEWLQQSSHEGGHWGVMIVLLIARLFVWITRRILWLLMMIGHVVSSFMLRQMEFDADRYETRVAGSDEFAATSDRIRMLSVASNAAFNDLQSAWQERRLGDDLALLIRHRDATMPSTIRDAVQKHSTAQSTSWLDTHPCDAARVRSSQRENAPGIFQLDGPATDLFSDFCTLSRDATVRFYQHDLGLPVKSENLISSSDLITSVGKQEEAQTSVTRYFQGLVHAVRPVFFSTAMPDKFDPDAAAELLLERRGKMLEEAAGLRTVAEAFREADQKLVNVRSARAMMSAGVKPDYDALKIPRGNHDSLRALEQSMENERNAAVEKLNAALRLQLERLQIALVLNSPRKPRAREPVPVAEADDFGEYELGDASSGSASGYDKLQTAFTALKSGSDAMEEMRQQWIITAALLQHLRQDGNNPQPFVSEVIARSRRVTRSLSDLRDALQKVPYPYEHVERDVTLSTFIVKGIPEAENVGGVMQVGEAAIDAYYPLYTRILADLCSEAELAEQQLGLEPLPAPESDPEPVE